MKWVNPSEISGRLVAPPSKSFAQRAIAAAVLADGESTIRNLGHCADVFASIRAAEALGATGRRDGDSLTLRGATTLAGGTIDCGEAGLCLRMFSAIAALSREEVSLVAQGSLQLRPVDMITGPLRQLGARCRTKDGRPPVMIRGPISGGHVIVDGRVSSQFLSGLLLALPNCRENSSVRATGLVSTPYVTMTLEVMKLFDIDVEWSDSLEEFAIPGNQSYRPTSVTVEADWSSAAMLIVAGAIAGSLEVAGLNLTSSQADRRILDVLDRAGVCWSGSGHVVKVSPGRNSGFDFDATHCPDLFMPLAALAVHCKGSTRIAGVGRLAAKESNRGAALVGELSKLGCNLKVERDELIIRGGPVKGGSLSARGDHRIAMAAAAIGLAAQGPVGIEGAS